MPDNAQGGNHVQRTMQAVSTSSGGNSGPVLFLLVVLFLIYLNRIGALAKIASVIRNPAQPGASGGGTPKTSATAGAAAGAIGGNLPRTNQFGLPNMNKTVPGNWTPRYNPYER